MRTSVSSTQASGVIRVQARLERCEIGNTRRMMQNWENEAYIFPIFPVAFPVPFHLLSHGETQWKGPTCDGLESHPGEVEIMALKRSFMLYET